MLDIEAMNQNRSPTSGQVVAHVARSVALLHAIETTITVVSSNATIVRSMSAEIKSVTQRVVKYAGAKALDPDGRACELLQLAGQAVSRLQSQCAHKAQAARADAELHEDDGVEDAWLTLRSDLEEFGCSLDDLADGIKAADAKIRPDIERIGHHAQSDGSGIVRLEVKSIQGRLYASSPDVPGLHVAGDTQESLNAVAIRATKDLFQRNRKLSVTVTPTDDASLLRVQSV